MSVWKSDETLRVVFSTLFSVFHLVMKHCISCLIYYFNMQRVVFIKEKQQTLRAISPPLLRTLTHRLNWASLRRTTLE